MKWGENAGSLWVKFVNDEPIVVQIAGEVVEEIGEYNGIRRTVYVCRVRTQDGRERRMRLATSLISGIRDITDSPVGQWFRIVRSGVGMNTKYHVEEAKEEDALF